MNGYILGIITLVFLVIITIVSNYVFILTTNQIKELWLGTILAGFLFGFIRFSLLDLDGDLQNSIFLPAAVFALWYFLTQYTANMINKDSDANVIRN